MRTGSFHRLASSLESAAFAVGMLSGALRRHPLAIAWSNRTAVEQALKLGALDGARADRDLMLAWIAELPVRPQSDEGATSRALRLFRCLLSATRKRLGGVEPDLDEARILGSVADLDRAWPSEGPVLLGVARAMTNVLSDSTEKRSVIHAAVPRILASRGLIPFPYPALGAVFDRNADVADAEFFAVGVVEAIGREAQAGLVFLREITIEWIDRHGRARRKRRQSKLPGAVDLASIYPVISPALVARHLGLSVRGASNIILEMEEDGLLVEIAGRSTWKAYVARELGALRSVLVERGSVLPSAARIAAALEAPKPAERDPPGPAEDDSAKRGLTAAELGEIAEGARIEERPSVETWKCVIELDEIIDGVNSAIRRSDAVLRDHGLPRTPFARLPVPPASIV